MQLWMTWNLIVLRPYRQPETSKCWNYRLESPFLDDTGLLRERDRKRDRERELRSLRKA